MHAAYRWILISTVALVLLPLSQSMLSAADYAVVVSKATHGDTAWRQVVDALVKKHGATVIQYQNTADQALDALREQFPRYTCFVAKPEDAGRAFVAQVHQLTRKLDDDPYTDTFWGILTGYDASNAMATARHGEPLVVRKVASGTEFATEMVTEGQWYDELVKNKHVKKEPGGTAGEQKGPDDTTQPLVDLLNSYKADLMITSGHATERDWQIGFRFRSGQFRCADGRLYGLDTQTARHPIDSPNPKVYLAVGNCLMGHVKDRDAMALAWMNSAGVRQMIGYTVNTWYGYAGWGCLDYFVEQPGRYTLAEAFHANHHALIHRLETYFPRQVARAQIPPGGRPRIVGLTLSDEARAEGLQPFDGAGLLYDRDVVAFYGDPKWSAKMAELPKYYDQALEIHHGVYTLTITPNRGKDSFKPVNTNGSQRGWRPIVQFLPHRIKDIQITAGEELKPLVTDNFILVPNPRECDPDRKYVVRFQAHELAL
jgi:zinc protease